MQCSRTAYGALGWQRTTFYEEGVRVNTMGAKGWDGPRRQKEMKEVFGLTL